jgi:hypothetical protein
MYELGPNHLNAPSDNTRIIGIKTTKEIFGNFARTSLKRNRSATQPNTVGAIKYLSAIPACAYETRPVSNPASEIRNEDGKRSEADLRKTIAVTATPPHRAKGNTRLKSQKIGIPDHQYVICPRTSPAPDC